MTWSFWAAYAAKLAVVGLVLAALYAVARKLRRLTPLANGRERYLSVVEARMLSQSAAVYVLKVGTRYVLVGSSNAGIATLAELTDGELSAKR